MKIKLCKKLAALFCAVLAISLLLPAALAANTPVTVSLSPVSGQKGETVTVDVTISEKSNAGNGSMIVNYDPAKLAFVSFKGGSFGGTAVGGLLKENGKEVPGKVSIGFMVSDTLLEKAVLGQVTFKILDDSAAIPLKLEMKELVAYAADGAETDLMDTVKTVNANVAIEAPSTAPSTTKPSTTAPGTTKPTTEKPEPTKPVTTQPITEYPSENSTAATAQNPDTGESGSAAILAVLAAGSCAALALITLRKRKAVH